MAWSQAQQTFMDADMRNPQRAGRHLLSVPKYALAPHETVYEFVVCTLKSDSFPLVIVTDQRVLYTEHSMIRRWRVRAELPAQQVTGAAYEQRWITGRLHVYGQHGQRFTAKVKLVDADWVLYVVDLINQLATKR